MLVLAPTGVAFWPMGMYIGPSPFGVQFCVLGFDFGLLRVKYEALAISWRRRIECSVCILTSVVVQYIDLGLHKHQQSYDFSGLTMY